MGGVDPEPAGGNGVHVERRFNECQTCPATVEPKEKSAVVRGKVWKQGDKEPEKWTVEYTDANPNVEGAAGLYGYVANATDTAPGSNIYYDNVSITPTGKK